MALIQVRLATPADTQTIADAHVTSWRHAYRGILSTEFLAGLAAAAKAERWQRTLDNPSHPETTWVVELDGVLMGFASVAPPRDEDIDPTDWLELMRIYLRPEAWGTGAAQALTAECLDEQRQYFLWVLSDNHRAQAFYRKLGFTPDGKDKPITIADTTVQELRMRRPARTS